MEKICHGDLFCAKGSEDLQEYEEKLVQNCHQNHLILVL